MNVAKVLLGIILTAALSLAKPTENGGKNPTRTLRYQFFLIVPLGSMVSAFIFVNNLPDKILFFNSRYWKR